MAKCRRKKADPVIPLTPARRDMADRHVGLALFLARRKAAACPWLDPEEARSVALFAMVEAAGRYRTEDGTRFTTYAYRCISWKLSSLASPASSPSRAWSPAFEPARDDPAPADPDGRMDHFLSHLGGRERLLVEMVALEGVGLGEAAARLGVSRGHVYKLWARSRRRLAPHRHLLEAAP